MAKGITHAERKRTNRLYKEAVDDYVEEWILRLTGLTPEMLMEAWDGEKLNVSTIMHAGKPKVATATQMKSRAEKDLGTISDFLKKHYADHLIGGTISENVINLLSLGLDVDEAGDKEDSDLPEPPAPEDVVEPDPTPEG